ncbi:hypothetical protein V5O48_004563 [Marasmius crinis-equi]|uniref:F-box domain-containing protein n=1 Tax=Marasmius crinis-equi TaxID=585013 RepID=A0ABR3FQ33_9AGAR
MAQARPLRAIDSQLVHSEHSLSELEIRRMSKLLEEEEHEKKLYEEEIASTRRFLEMLEHRKRNLETNMEHRRSTFSTLRKVPPEIWEIIFTEVCSSTASGYSLAIGLAQKPQTLEMRPIVLSQVCSRWRRITQGFPKLWTSISVHLAGLRPGCQDIVSTFLQNSGNHRLNVRIQLRASDVACVLAETNAIIWKQLAQHLWRCWKISLDTDDFALLEIPLGLQQISFPHLTVYEGETTLSLVGQNLRGSWWEALQQAPNLTEITTCFLYPFDTIPYTRLTTLTFRCLFPLEVRKLYEFLPFCERLETLTLGCVDQGGATTADGYHLDPVEIRSLRSLVIEGYGTLNIHCSLLTALLGSLMLPSLGSFDLRCQGYTMYRCWPPSLLDFLRRTSPTLRKFHLFMDHCALPVDTTLQPTLVSALLETVSNVQTLRIAMEREGVVNANRYQDAADFFVSDLFGRFGFGRKVLPELESLEVYMSDISLGSSVAGMVVNAAARGSSSPQPFPCRVSVTRIPSPASYGNGTGRLERRVGRPKVLDLGVDVGRKMAELERDAGVKVVIRDLDGFPAELESAVRRRN